VTNCIMKDFGVSWNFSKILLLFQQLSLTKAWLM